jgi:MFS family permease
MAMVFSVDTPYADVIGPFLLAGIGMSLFFPPVSLVILNAVRPEEEGQASGANNAIRELGGVFGVAVLATIFTRYGSYNSPHAFSQGLIPPTWVGAAVVAVGALAALAVPGRRPRSVEPVAAPTTPKEAHESGSSR